MKESEQVGLGGATLSHKSVSINTREAKLVCAAHSKKIRGSDIPPVFPFSD